MKKRLITFFIFCQIFVIFSENRWGLLAVNFFFTHIFQFDLAIAPIQNTDLINGKYNDALSDIWYSKYNNALHGAINTNRLNVFTLILNNIFEILSLENK